MPTILTGTYIELLERSWNRTETIKGGNRILMCDDKCLCRKFARIIDGQPGFAGGKCVATISRNQLNSTILGKRFRVTSSFSFESRNRATGKALCLGRVALLQRETQGFISALRKQGIIVSSVRNEWLFERPRLIYINMEAVENPLIFARKVRKALNIIS